MSVSSGGNATTRDASLPDETKTLEIARRCMQLGQRLFDMHGAVSTQHPRQLRVLLLQAQQIFVLLRSAWEEVEHDCRENYDLDSVDWQEKSEDDCQHTAAIAGSEEREAVHVAVQADAPDLHCGDMLECVKAANRALEFEVQSLQHRVAVLEAALAEEQASEPVPWFRVTVETSAGDIISASIEKAVTRDKQLRVEQSTGDAFLSFIDGQRELVDHLFKFADSFAGLSSAFSLAWRLCFSFIDSGCLPVYTRKSVMCLQGGQQFVHDGVEFVSCAKGAGEADGSNRFQIDQEPSSFCVELTQVCERVPEADPIRQEDSSCDEHQHIIHNFLDAAPKVAELKLVVEIGVQQHDTLGHYESSARAATPMLLPGADKDRLSQRPVSFYRVNQEVLVRRAPSLLADTTGSKRSGAVVLGSITEDHLWLELVSRKNASSDERRFMPIDGAPEGLGILLNVMTDLRCFLQSELGDQVTDDPFEVVEVSGSGGLFSTFIVSQNLSSFVLRLQCKFFFEHDRTQMRTAVRLLAARDLSPRTISDGSFWSIHEYGGLDLRSSSQPPSMQELARLLAELHNVPSSWFDERREWLRNHDEWLRAGDEFESFPAESHVWFVYNGIHLFEPPPHEFTNSDIFLWFHRTEYYPSSPAARRVVTCHGDFHFGNILRTPSGNLVCVDLDFCCATFAIHDIAQLFEKDVRDPGERHDFAQAYLLAVGEAADQAAIDELIFEARCYRIAFETDMTKYSDFATSAAIRCAKQQKSNTALREAIINGSIDDAIVIWREQQRLIATWSAACALAGYDEFMI